MTNLVLGGVKLFLSRIPYLRLREYDMKKLSSCIRRSLSLCNTFPSQRSIPRYITREFDIILKAIGCEMNRFLGKAAVSILSESPQLTPNNEFVTEE